MTAEMARNITLTSFVEIPNRKEVFEYDKDVCNQCLPGSILFVAIQLDKKIEFW